MVGTQVVAGVIQFGNNVLNCVIKFDVRLPTAS